MPQTLLHNLASVARYSPDQVAIESGKNQISYSLLWNMIEELGSVLCQKSEEGCRAVLLLDNSIHYIVALYGCWYAGLIAVPIDPKAREREVRRVVEHAQPTLILSSKRQKCGAVIAAESSIEFIDVVDLVNPSDIQCDTKPNGADNFERVYGRSMTCEALLIYTSGTAGSPKGVLLSHQNIYQNTASIVGYLELSSLDSAVVVLPFHYSYGNSVLHMHLFVGAKLIIGNSMMYPQHVTDQLRASTATGISGVASTFSLLLSRSDFKKNPPALRYITQAGGPMTKALTERILQSKSVDTSLFIMYGQTEATARLTWLPPKRIEEKEGSVGIPISGVEIRVITKNGDSAGIGNVGEVLARGKNIMLGYWNNSEESEAALAGGWLHTGDLGVVDADNFLYLHGRASEMIKVGAHRISPVEIEEIILELEYIHEVAVCGVPDEILGQVPVAFIVGSGSVERTRSVLAHCRRSLSLHKVPKNIEWVISLPKTASGKPRKWMLTESYNRGTTR